MLKPIISNTSLLVQKCAYANQLTYDIQISLVANTDSTMQILICRADTNLYSPSLATLGVFFVFVFFTSNQVKI